MKIADKLFKKLGYTKTLETSGRVEYEKLEELCLGIKYTHKIAIIHKMDCYEFEGNALFMSYDPDLFDAKEIGNTNVGMSVKEMRACIRKWKELKW